MVTAVTGFLTGLGLIVAIGAQNAFVLRQGIRREHVGIVVAVCLFGDVLLIAIGTAGLGVFLNSVPWLIEVFRWGGVAYLLWCAWGNIRSAMRPQALDLSDAPRVGAKGVALTTAGITFLNPHVYLDTVLMLGNLANQTQAPWLYAGGAMLGSLVWFTGLGYGAHRLAPLLRSPQAWRWIDIGVAAVMILVAAKLAFFL